RCHEPLPARRSSSAARLAAARSAAHMGPACPAKPRAMPRDPPSAARDPGSTGMTDTAIVLDDIDLSLGRGAARVHILKGISLAIARGEAVGLVGPSGSGKSTLLMTMAGLERPDSGRVAVDGADLSRLDEDALARFRGRRISIVFQS